MRWLLMAAALVGVANFGAILTFWSGWHVKAPRKAQLSRSGGLTPLASAPAITATPRPPSERQKDAALADSALLPPPTTPMRRGAEISRGSAVGRGSARHGRAQPHNFAFNASSTDASYLAKIWPTVLILGIQKGGTTTLAHFLLRQSGFCKNNGPWGGKESTFLLPDKHNNPDDYYTITGVDQKCSRRAQPADWEPARTGTGPPILNGNVHIRGRHIDGTPVLNEDGVARSLFTGMPEALRSRLKFIVLLREPLSRDMSMYNHIRGMKADWGFCPETESTRYGSNGYSRFLGENLKCRQSGSGCSACMHKFFEYGHYAQHLKEWFSYFGRQQFFILQSDALNVEAKGKRNVEEVLRKLGTFLEVQSHGVGDEWENYAHKRYQHEHKAEGYRGSQRARIEHLTAEQCKTAASIFGAWNKELYALLSSTRQDAPSSEPPFMEFLDPCVRAAGLPEMA